jgi:hypothetical protein
MSQARGSAHHHVLPGFGKLIGHRHAGDAQPHNNHIGFLVAIERGGVIDNARLHLEGEALFAADVHAAMSFVVLRDLVAPARTLSISARTFITRPILNELPKPNGQLTGLYLLRANRGLGDRQPEDG